MSNLLSIILSFSFLSLALSSLVLPQIFSDNCVLQTNAEYGERSSVYGYSDPNEFITVILRSSETKKLLSGPYNVTADRNGSWQVTLNPLGDAMPAFDIVVFTDSGDTFTASSCFAGDVYIASGQSNMCFSSSSSFPPAPDYWNTTWPNIHLFSVQMIQALEPARVFPPITNTSQCTWNHDKATNQSDFPCNTWLPSTPHYNGLFSAVGFMTAIEIMKQHTGSRHIGIIYSAFGGTSISLWAPPSAYVGCPAETNEGGGLYNAMISPLARFSIRSFLYFQGEQDVVTESKNPGWYACRHERLIAYWRKAWGFGDISFCFVQLGPVDDPGPPFGLVRTSQTLALPRSNGTTDITGMAVTYDLGDTGTNDTFGSVHFRNKVTVSKRLAAAVLHAQFALQNASLFGPVLTGFSSVSSSSVTINIRVEDGSGVKLADCEQCTLCCQQSVETVQLSQDGGLTWCNSTLSVTSSGESVVATKTADCNGNTNPITHVRTGWMSFPQCAIVAVGNGFPISAFSVSILPTTQQVSVTRSIDAKSLSNPSKGGQLLWKGQLFSWTGQTPPPPMGLNTWNAYHVNIDENIIHAIADAFISLGLTSAGYKFINLDDGCFVDRMSNGTISEDPVRFPSGMKALADSLHNRNLLFGVYTSATSLTCQKRPGTYGFEAIDVQRYCEYGVDYLKVDNCGGTRYPQANESWIPIRDAIEKCVSLGGRRQTLSVEYCHANSSDDCEAWIGKLADLWRTTGDVQANFASFMSNLDLNNENAVAMSPGKYNDPDLLVVNLPGLSVMESQTQFSAWALVAAPMLLSFDVTQQISPEILQIITNSEVIAVSQDAAQIQGVRVSEAAPSGVECWARPLSPPQSVILDNLGSQYISALLVNRGDEKMNATCTWTQLGLSGSATVRDLYAHRDLGAFDGEFSVILDPHESLLVSMIGT